MTKWPTALPFFPGSPGPHLADHKTLGCCYLLSHLQPYKSPGLSGKSLGGCLSIILVTLLSNNTLPSKNQQTLQKPSLPGSRENRADSKTCIIYILPHTPSHCLGDGELYLCDLAFVCLLAITVTTLARHFF